MDQDTSENKKTLLALIILIILLALLSTAVWWFKKPGVNQVNINDVKVASSGTLIEGLNKEFILASDASVIDSRQTDTSRESGTLQSTLYSVVYDTKNTLNELFATYLNYLQTNNYLIERSSVREDGSQIKIVAAKADTRLSVNLEDISENGTDFTSRVGITLEK